MPDLLPSWPLLSAFLLASLILAITPGPGVFYIVARSLAQGRRAGLASVLGVALGNLGNALLAAWGLAALLAVSSLAFVVMKWLGAAYLVFLGWRTLRGAGRDVVAVSEFRGGARRALADGVLVALLNPKTMVFYAAFLPQFMTVSAPASLQGMVLGVLFVAIALVTDTVYALAASALTPMLEKRAGPLAWGRRLSGAVLVGLGVTAALANRGR